MKILQEIFQHFGIAGLVQNMVKTVVQLRHLLHMSLGCMETCKIYVFLQLLQLFRRDILCGKSGTHPLQRGTDHIDILHILGRDAGDISSFIRNNLNQTFQLQLPEGLPHRGSGHAQLFPDGHLPQLFILLIFST